MYDYVRRSSWSPRLATITILTGLVCAVGSLPTRAESETRVVEDKLVFRLGGYLTDFKTDASVGTGGVIGTLIRLENTLGIEDDKSIARLDGFVRFNERHALDFGLWSLDRVGFTTIDEQIVFEGNTFDIGVDLASKFDTSWLRLGWRYSVLRTDRGEAGFSAGLSAYDFSVGIAGEATVSDGMGGTTVQAVRAEEDLLTPVPTVGMFITFAIKPRLILVARADFLDLEISDFEGNLLDTRVLIEWYFSQHVGFGVGTNTTEIAIRDTGDDPFSVDYRQSGVLGYFTFAF